MEIKMACCRVHDQSSSRLSDVTSASSGSPNRPIRSAVDYSWAFSSQSQECEASKCWRCMVSITTDVHNVSKMLHEALWKHGEVILRTTTHLTKIWKLHGCEIDKLIKRIIQNKFCCQEALQINCVCLGSSFYIFPNLRLLTWTWNSQLSNHPWTCDLKENMHSKCLAWTAYVLL